MLHMLQEKKHMKACSKYIIIMLVTKKDFDEGKACFITTEPTNKTIDIINMKINILVFPFMNKVFTLVSK